MKTIRKIVKEIVDNELGERGLLAGDLAQVLANKIWSAIQERKDSKGEACPGEWMTSLYVACGIDPYTATVGMRQQVSDCGKALIQSGAELIDLECFKDWWKKHTVKWSFDSSHPTPKQIRDNWGKFKTANNHAAPLVVR